MQAGVVKPNTAVLQQNQGVILTRRRNPENFPSVCAWIHAVGRGAAARVGVTESWPPCLLSALPVFVASLCPCCTQEEVRLSWFWFLLYPLGFSWGCYCPVSSPRPQRVLAQHSHVFSAFMFFTLLDLLVYLYSWNQWHFSSRQSLQFETARSTEDGAGSKGFWGGGSTVLQVVSSHRNNSPTPFLSPVPPYECFGIATLISLLYLLILLPCL